MQRLHHVGRACEAKSVLWMLNIFILVILYGASSAATMDRFMKVNGGINHSHGGGFDRYFAHQVERPFAYRVLLPSIVDAITPVIEENMTEGLRYRFIIGTPLKEYMGVSPDTPVNLTMSIRYHLGYFMSFASLVGLAFVLRSLTLAVIPGDCNLSNLAPLAFVLLLPLTFLHGGFLYDFPELLFLAVSFLMMIRHRIVALSLVTFLAVLNKESNVLIPVFYAAYVWNEIPRNILIKRTGFLILVASIAYALVRYLARDAGGVVVMDHLARNLAFMANAESWLTFFRPYGGLVEFPRGYNIMLLSILFLVFINAWKNIPAGMRRVFFVAMGANCLLVLAFGNRDEIRNWSLFFIPIYLSFIIYFNSSARKSGRLEMERSELTDK